MEREPSVQIREDCEQCGATGTRTVEAGAGHVRWGKRVACPDSDGTGQQARWIPLSELKSLLER